MPAIGQVTRPLFVLSRYPQMTTGPDHAVPSKMISFTPIARTVSCPACCPPATAKPPASSSPGPPARWDGWSAQAQPGEVGATPLPRVPGSGTARPGTPGTHPAAAPQTATQARQSRSATGSGAQHSRACGPSISTRTGQSACQDPYEDHPHIMHERTTVPVDTAEGGQVVRLAHLLRLNSPDGRSSHIEWQPEGHRRLCLRGA